MALTLRLLGGLTVPEIARAFLVQETTMARRITRAKAKIKAAHIPYRVPSADDIRERLAGVLAVVYLIFNEGYLAGERGRRRCASTSPTRRSTSAACSGPAPGRRRGSRTACLDALHRRPASRRACRAPESW